MVLDEELELGYFGILAQKADPQAGRALGRRPSRPGGGRARGGAADGCACAASPGRRRQAPPRPRGAAASRGRGAGAPAELKIPANTEVLRPSRPRNWASTGG